MKRVGLLLLIGFIPFLLNAQLTSFSTASDNWHYGSITLQTGETIKANINYNIATDLITLKTSKYTKLFSPIKIASFKIENAGVPEEYYAIDHSENYGTDIFLKVEQTANYLVLARYLNRSESYTTNTYDMNGDWVPSGSNTVIEINEAIYIMDKNGNLESIMSKYVGTLTQKKNLIGNPSKKNADLKTNNARLIAPKKYKLTNKKVLKEFLGNDYNSFENYVDAHDLDIKTLEGLLEALNFKN